MTLEEFKRKHAIIFEEMPDDELRAFWRALNKFYNVVTRAPIRKKTRRKLDKSVNYICDLLFAFTGNADFERIREGRPDVYKEYPDVSEIEPTISRAEIEQFGLLLQKYRAHLWTAGLLENENELAICRLAAFIDFELGAPDYLDRLVRLNKEYGLSGA